jgi:hypothetical protein
MTISTALYSESIKESVEFAYKLAHKTTRLIPAILQPLPSSNNYRRTSHFSGQYPEANLKNTSHSEDWDNA